MKYLKNIKIPLPPLDIQEKIVKECEEIDKINEKLKKENEELKKEIEEIVKNIDGNEEKLGNILSLEYGKNLPIAKRIKGEYPVVGSNGVIGYHNTYFVKSPCIIVGRKGSAGKVTWINKDCYPIDTTFYVVLKKNAILKFIYYQLKVLNLQGGGTGVPGINRNEIYKVTIPLPPIQKQKQIMTQIEFIENKIEKNNQKLNSLKNKKEEILREYL